MFYTSNTNALDGVKNLTLGALYGAAAAGIGAVLEYFPVESILIGAISGLGAVSIASFLLSIMLVFEKECDATLLVQSTPITLVGLGILISNAPALS